MSQECPTLASICSINKFIKYDKIWKNYKGIRQTNNYELWVNKNTQYCTKQKK